MILLSQDIDFSGGGTATGLTLIDRLDFGGEIRSIASASVYGNYGIMVQVAEVLFMQLV